jgi:tetratricopeptide (TPR) repeat protein
MNQAHFFKKILAFLSEKLSLYFSDNIFREMSLVLLYFFLFTLPWFNFSGANNPLMLEFFYFLGAVGLFLILLILGSTWGWLKIPKSSFFWLVGLLLLSKVLSTLFSPLLYRSLWGAYMIMSDGLIFFVGLLVFGWFVFALQLKAREVEFIFSLLFLQTIILSIQTLVEAVNGGAPGIIFRPNSPLLNSDYFISYLCLMIPIGIALMISRYRRGEMLLPVLFLSGVVFTFLAMYTVLPTDLQKIGRFQKSVSSTSQKGAGASSAAGSFLNSDANTERFTQWHLGLEIGAEHWLAGSGLGTTRAFFFQHTQDLANWNYLFSMDFPHNDLIQQFSQGGIIGLISYILMWGSVFWLSIKNRLKVQAEYRTLFGGILIGLGFFLFFNLFLFTVQITAILYTVFIIAALSLTKNIHFQSLGYQNWNWWLWVVIILILAVPTFYLGWNYLQAENLANQALVAESQGDYQEASLDSEQAVSYFPGDENYQMLDSSYHAMLAFQEKDPSKRGELFTEAKQEIAEAIKLNPYLTKQKLNQGIIDYVQASGGSVQETAAIKEMLDVLRQIPYNQYFYLYAAQSLTNRVNLSAAKNFFQGALQIAPTPKIKDYVQSLENQVL